MKNAIQIFKNNQFGEVRVVEIDGKTYFVGSDVARALGYTNPHDAIIKHCKPEGVAIREVIDSLGRKQDAKFINEGNIYRLAAKSKLPGAEAFESWIFDEVLPAIHKHGGYLTPEKVEEALLNPDTLIMLATNLKEERAKRIKTEQQLEAKSKQLDESKEWYSIKRYAKENGLNWRKINWRALKALSYEYGYEVKKIFDANYGEVNIYHRSVFEILHRAA